MDGVFSHQTKAFGNLCKAGSPEDQKLAAPVKACVNACGAQFPEPQARPQAMPQARPQAIWHPFHGWAGKGKK